MTETAASPPTAPGIGEPRVLTSSTQKWLMVTLIGAVFVVIGIFMIFTKGDFLAWFVTLFFGLVAGVGLYQVFGPGGRLELGPDTFTIVNLGRRTTERWDECADFATYRTGPNELVAYDRARDMGTHMAEMNRMLSGRSAGLPDTFGMKARDIADLMNAYREHAVARAWQRHTEAIAKFRAIIASGLEKSGQAANIVTEPEAMNLPEGMPPWPAILVTSQAPRGDGTRHILIVADVLSPLSRWISDAEKQEQAFSLLQADELQIIDTEQNVIRRIPANGKSPA